MTSLLFTEHYLPQVRAGEWWHSYAGTNTSQEDEVACAYHCRDNRRPDTNTFYTAFSFSEEAAVCRSVGRGGGFRFKYFS